MLTALTETSVENRLRSAQCRPWQHINGRCLATENKDDIQLRITVFYVHKLDYVVNIKDRFNSCGLFAYINSVLILLYFYESFADGGH